MQDIHLSEMLLWVPGHSSVFGNVVADGFPEFGVWSQRKELDGCVLHFRLVAKAQDRCWKLAVYNQGVTFVLRVLPSVKLTTLVAVLVEYCLKEEQARRFNLPYFSARLNSSVTNTWMMSRTGFLHVAHGLRNAAHSRILEPDTGYICFRLRLSQLSFLLRFHK